MTRELTKVLYQRRTYIGWGGLLILPFILALAFSVVDIADAHAQSPDPIARLLTGGVYENGLFLSLLMLMMLGTFLLPLLGSMAGSQTVAGEAEKGTLRTTLMQPVGRTRLLLAKWGVASVYMIIGLAILTGASLAAGASFFGVDPLSFVSGEDMSAGGSVLRILASFGYVFVGMLAVISLALLLSTLTDSSLTAAAGALVLVIIMAVLGSFTVFDFLKPYLITTHLDAWQGLLQMSTDWEPMWKGLINFAVWTVGTLGLALWRFNRKDITS